MGQLSYIIDYFTTYIKTRTYHKTHHVVRLLNSEMGTWFPNEYPVSGMGMGKTFILLKKGATQFPQWNNSFLNGVPSFLTLSIPDLFFVSKFALSLEYDSA